MSVPTTRSWATGHEEGGYGLIPDLFIIGGQILSPSFPLVGALFWPQFASVTAENCGNLPLGGGSANVTPPPPPPRPTPDRILRRPANMTNQQWNIVERLFREVDNNCVGRALVDRLMGSLTGTGRIEVRFDDAGSNRFRVQGGIIFLHTDAAADTFFHELFHSLQAFGETLETWGTVERNPLLNLEMEARYAQYLFLRQTSWFAGSAVERAWERDPSRRTIMQLTNYLSSHGNLHNLSLAPDLNTHITNRIMPELRAVRGHEQLMFDPNRVGIVNFNRIRGLTINCP